MERFSAQLSQETSDERLGGYYTSCYEACLPRRFGDVVSTDVVHNKAVFSKIVLK